MDKKMFLFVGLLAVGAILILKRSQPVQYVAPVTNNAYRDSKVNDILAAVAAAGATATQIANLIKQINASSDSGVNSLYTQTFAGDGGGGTDYGNYA